MTVYVFNGPPSSGKDECCEFLWRMFSIRRLAFKQSLLTYTAEYFGVTEQYLLSGYTRENKELPDPQLGGMSRRKALIHVAEDVYKPRYGDQVFAERTVQQINTIDRYTISDCGFNVELETVVNTLSNRVVLIRLFRDNCTYAADSRRYVGPDLHVSHRFVNGWKTTTQQSDYHQAPPVLERPIIAVEIHNNGSIDQLHRTLLTISGCYG